MGSEKIKIAFIINPVSGSKRKDHVPALIEKILDKEKFEIIIRFTQHIGHATELADDFVTKNVHILVSVGGDGTVNEIGRALIGTNTALGIIPFGSGNGLARHLNIPLDTESALKLLNYSSIISIDYGIANDHVFFCTCGVGFDAYVGQQFANAAKRGFLTYLKTTVWELFGYKSKKYKLITSQGILKIRAFLITFANANQWGNNVYVAPHADIQDGKMEVCILSPFPFLAIPFIGVRLFKKSLDQSHFITTFNTSSIELTRKKKGIFHFDGEPVETRRKIKIRIIKQGLKVVVACRSVFNVESI